MSLTSSVSIPGRTLAVVRVNKTLTQEQSGHLYEIEPNYLLTNVHPNLYIIPTIYNVDVYKCENVPLVVIIFSSDNIYLPKEEMMGFMQCKSLDVSEIVTETSTEPSSIFFDEDDETGGSEIEHKTEVPLGPNEKKFITSLADIDINRKDDLQDTEITKEHQEAFKELCDEYKDIFSVDCGVTNTRMYLLQVHWGYYQTLIWSLLALYWV